MAVLLFCKPCGKVPTSSTMRRCETCGRPLKWRALAQVGGRRVYAGLHPTKTAAKAAERAKLAELDAGTHVDPNAITVGDYVTQRLNEIERTVDQPDGIRGSTFRNYRSIARRRLAPIVGVRLQDVTTRRLRVFYTELRSDGLSPKSVRNVHALLRSILQTATEDQLIRSNPADVRGIVPTASSAKRGREQDRRKIAAWDLDTVLGFLRHRGDAGDPLLALWAAAFATGGRRGELLESRWSDVDLGTDAEVTIARSYVRGQHGLEVADTTKGGESRTVPLLLRGDDVDVVEILRAHRAESPGIGDALVFSHPNGTHLDPDVVSAAFVDAVADSGIDPRITLHGARHSWVVWLLRAGIPVRTVSTWAGHATPSFTEDRYNHFIPRDDSDARALASRALRAAGGEDR